MRSTLIIIIGVILIAVGAWLLYNAYSGSEAGSAAIAWAAIIIGALVTLFGFGKRVDDAMADPVSEESEQAHAEIKALIQSMGAIAAADAKIQDTEVATIARIHEQMLGIRIEHAEIREILSEIGPKFNIARRLEENRSNISPTMKSTIIQSCHLVMISDLEVDKIEENQIFEIGKALGFDREQIEDLVATAST